MGEALYNISVLLYGLAVRLVSPFNAKAKLFIKGRQGIFSEIASRLKGNETPLVWFHCASLGEFEQGRPVIEAYRKAQPKHKILITFFSPSGYELRKNYQSADFVFYLPLDSKKNATQFLDLVKPTLAVFVKYEFWHHYIKEVATRQIPLICISALFNEKQRFFKPSGGFFRNTLSYFDHIFVQNEESMELLKGININKVTVAGDTRFDRVVQTVSKPQQFPLIEQFSKNNLTVIIGSCWPADMQFLFPIINGSSGVRFIIAPHDVSESSVRQIEKGLDKTYCRITEADSTKVDKSEVVIVNTVGMLSSLYQYGQFAYIGGAFGDGLHNILEAVTFGLPVIFGNNNLEKYPESTALIEKGGAFAFTEQKEIDQYFNRMTNDTEFRTEASKKCKAYIEENTGATAKIMESISQWSK